VSYSFEANFYTFQQCKNFENRLKYDKVTDSLKVGTFFGDTVYSTSLPSLQPFS